MSANLNKVMLAGRVSISPRLKSSTSGVTICTFSIAVNHRYRASDGSQQEDTDFMEITVYGKTADQCANYLKTGSPVFLEAHLKQETWVDKNTGKNRQRLTLVGDRVHFLGASPETVQVPLDPEVQQAFRQAAHPPRYTPATPPMMPPVGTPSEMPPMSAQEYGDVPF